MKTITYFLAQESIKSKILEAEIRAEQFADYVLEKNPPKIRFNDDNLYNDFILERLH